MVCCALCVAIPCYFGRQPEPFGVRGRIICGRRQHIIKKMIENSSLLFAKCAACCHPICSERQPGVCMHLSAYAGGVHTEGLSTKYFYINIYVETATIVTYADVEKNKTWRAATIVLYQTSTRIHSSRSTRTKHTNGWKEALAAQELGQETQAHKKTRSWQIRNSHPKQLL